MEGSLKTSPLCHLLTHPKTDSPPQPWSPGVACTRLNQLHVWVKPLRLYEHKVGRSPAPPVALPRHTRSEARPRSSEACYVFCDSFLHCPHLLGQTSNILVAFRTAPFACTAELALMIRVPQSGET